jgi:hypothetical protein
MLLGLAIFAGYLLTIGLIHVDGWRDAARGERPLFTDFTSTYAASMLLQQKPAVDLYRGREIYQASLFAAQAAYDGILNEKQLRAAGLNPWMYPPTFIPLVWPLAYVAYLPAWLLWLVVTAIPYLVALRGILKDQSFWLIALGAPPVFFNMMYGQNGFLITGLIALGLVWLKPHPALAGICIGLASVKPHFGLLIPFALICGAHWKTFWTALATFIAMLLATLLLFGADPWYGFIGSLLSNLRGFELGVYKMSVMPSVFSALHQAGLSLSAASIGQLIAAGMALAAVVWAWWWQPGRTSPPGLEAAVLCTATLVAVPSVYLYDLMLLVPAIAWLWADMRDHGHQRWELWLLISCCAGLIGLREIDSYGSTIGAGLTALLLLLAMTRLRSARRHFA